MPNTFALTRRSVAMAAGGYLGLDARARASAAPTGARPNCRYKANHQRAMRDGDFKLLEVLDNTFLFDEAPESFGHAFTGGQLADHVGAGKARLDVADTTVWPD